MVRVHSIELGRSTLFAGSTDGNLGIAAIRIVHHIVRCGWYWWLPLWKMVMFPSGKEHEDLLSLNSDGTALVSLQPQQPLVCDTFEFLLASDERVLCVRSAFVLDVG